MVVHQPGGLSLLTRADSVLWALATTQDVIQSPTPPAAGQPPCSHPGANGTG